MTRNSHFPRPAESDPYVLQLYTYSRPQMNNYAQDCFQKLDTCVFLEEIICANVGCDALMRVTGHLKKLGEGGPPASRYLHDLRTSQCAVDLSRPHPS